MKNGTISLEQIIDLLEQKKYSELHALISYAEPQDIAEFFENLTKEQYPVLFRILSKEMATEVFVELGADQQQYLIELFSDVELKEVLDDLFIDDTVDIIEEMDKEIIQGLNIQFVDNMKEVLGEALA